MASTIGRLTRLSAFTRKFTSSKGSGSITPVRTETWTRSGGVLPKPKKAAFGLTRIALVVVPFLYVGTWIGENFAEALVKRDIYIHEEDDDDDDD